MTGVMHSALRALLMAAAMFWQVGWSLVLGFVISAMLQVVVPQARIVAAFGRAGPRQIALATLAGAASSSCSYAAAAVSRTLFKKGASLTTSLAFLFASTNLVAELGLVLLLLMGWQFMAGEWLGGVLLVALMSVIVGATAPRRLIEAARRHPEPHGHGHDHAHDHAHDAAAPDDPNVWRTLRRKDTWIAVAQHFAMDWSMLWKDLLIGFLIAGALAAFVPEQVWQTLFVRHASLWIQVPANALLGPIVAVLSFVCSIGNVAMAAVLWGAGVSFGGVLAFLFADLIVLPLLDVYRRYYGWRMAAYIAAVFYATMVIAAILMDVAFRGLGWIPLPPVGDHAVMPAVSLNYTFWLNLLFGGVALVLFSLTRGKAGSSHCAHHGHGQSHAHGHDHDHEHDHAHDNGHAHHPGQPEIRAHQHETS